MEEPTSNPSDNLDLFGLSTIVGIVSRLLIDVRKEQFYQNFLFAPLLHQASVGLSIEFVLSQVVT